MVFARSRRLSLLIWIYQLVQVIVYIALGIWDTKILRKEQPIGSGPKTYENPFYINLLTWDLPFYGNCAVFGFLSRPLYSPPNEHREKQAIQIISVGCAFIIEVFRILGFGIYMAYFCSSTPLCFEDITRTFYCLITLCAFGVVFFSVGLYKALRELNSNSREPRIYTYSTKNRTKIEQEKTTNSYCDIIGRYRYCSCFAEKNVKAQNVSNVADTEEAITKLIRHLWKNDCVGKGVDAKGLTHSSIKVESIRTCDNNDLLQRYMTQKVLLTRYSDSYGLLGSYHEFSDPILTNQKIRSDEKYHVLSKNIDNSVNEAYLFHGTDSANVDSILMNGFDVTKCSRPFCGRGVYFAESPVKSDQYTGPVGQESYVMILSRVLLGNMVLITDPKLMQAKNRPICSECLSTDCSNVYHRFEHQFDSVVLDRKHGLFREFVIFDDCLAYPEFVITYKRLYGYSCITS